MPSASRTTQVSQIDTPSLPDNMPAIATVITAAVLSASGLPAIDVKFGSGNVAVVVTDKCQKCRFTECVAICPVSCFHGDEMMLYIDPEICIECQACIPACPVHAIYNSDDLPGDKLEWVGVNE